MTAAAAAALSDQTRRPPLLPSEGERRPKSRQVTSRYLSSSSTPTSTSSSTTTSYSSNSSSSNASNASRRSATPLASTTTSSTGLSFLSASSPAIKRSQSVERRRPATPRPAAHPSNIDGSASASSVSVASKILITSTRSLAVSFQGESFSLPISKTKALPPPQISSYLRKTTPDRRRNTTTPTRGGDQVENSKPLDQHRWPGRTRQQSQQPQQPKSLSRSLDCTTEKRRVTVSANVVRALQQSLIDEGSRDSRVSFEGKLKLVKSIQFPVDTSDSIDGSVNSSVTSDLNQSDTESVLSGANWGNSGMQECGGLGMRRSSILRGISVPARFWQETNSRLRRLQDPGSLSVPTGCSGAMAASKVKRFSVDSPSSSPRGMSSPLRGPVRPASPSKLMVSTMSSPSRGMSSPSRTRNQIGGAVVGQLSNVSSVLSFPGRGKMGENRINDAHLLRLYHNRELQWRFVNARAYAAMLVQRSTVERNVYDAWITMSELRDSVTIKRIKLQFLRQYLKLTSILKGQMTYLEECDLLDRDHSSSLSGAIDALEASTLRLPVVDGARGDIQNMKDAVRSAVDVMQAMGSSMCFSLSKVEEVNNLTAELATVTRREKAVLDQCKYLLSMLAAMQVNESSLRTNILQLKHVPTSLTTQVS